MSKKAINPLSFIAFFCFLPLVSSLGYARSSEEAWTQDHFCRGWLGRTEVKIHLMDLDLDSAQDDADCIQNAGIVLIERHGKFRSHSVIVNAERYSLCGNPFEIRFRGGRLVMEALPIDELAPAELELSGEAAEEIGAKPIKVFCQALDRPDLD